jgi:hypothetical protein
MPYKKYLKWYSIIICVLLTPIFSNDVELVPEKNYSNIFFSRYNQGLVTRVPNEQIYRYNITKYVNIKYSQMQKEKSAKLINNIRSISPGYYLVYNENSILEYLYLTDTDSLKLLGVYKYRQTPSNSVLIEVDKVERYGKRYAVSTRMLLADTNLRQITEYILPKLDSLSFPGKIVYQDEPIGSMLYYNMKGELMAKLYLDQNHVKKVTIFKLEILKFSEGDNYLVPQYNPQIYNFLDYYKNKCLNSMNDIRVELENFQTNQNIEDIYLLPKNISMKITSGKDLIIKINYKNSLFHQSLTIERNGALLMGGIIQTKGNIDKHKYSYIKNNKKETYVYEQNRNSYHFSNEKKEYYFAKVFKYFIDNECSIN